MRAVLVMPFLRVSSASVETVHRTTFCSGHVALYTEFRQGTEAGK